jgi:hypothetical protein
MQSSSILVIHYEEKEYRGNPKQRGEIEGKTQTIDCQVSTRLLYACHIHFKIVVVMVFSSNIT